eukprot:1621945-Rhodomonas_salina.1
MSPNPVRKDLIWRCTPRRNKKKQETAFSVQIRAEIAVFCIRFGGASRNCYAGTEMRLACRPREPRRPDPPLPQPRPPPPSSCPSGALSSARASSRRPRGGGASHQAVGCLFDARRDTLASARDHVRAELDRASGSELCQ